MKKLSRVLSLVVVLVLLASSLAFADTLKLDSTYPEDGYTNAAVDNFGVKLFFNKPVAAKANQEANDSVIKLTDAKGKEVPTMIFYSDKEEGLVLVLADITNPDVLITQNSEYKVTVGADFTADDGSTLGDEQVITVTTLDQTKSSKVSTIMMIVMMVLVMFLGARTSKKPEKEEKKETVSKVNPYKESKKTGKSVSEIVAEDQKRKEKEAVKAAKAKEKEDKLLAEIEAKLEKEEPYNPYYKKVKKPAPIKKAGGKFKPDKGNKK